MAFQLVLNVFIAIVWMFMSASSSSHDIHHRLLNWSYSHLYDETIFQGKALYSSVCGQPFKLILTVLQRTGAFQHFSPARRFAA